MTSAPSQHVAVIGAGAIGGVVAALLAAETRHEVTVCLRPPSAGGTPINRLVVRRADGSEVVANPRFVSHPDDLAGAAAAADVVLLATKAYQSEAARPWLERLCRAGTVVAVCQNGIDQVERVQPLAPRATVIPVVVQLAADRVAPDQIRQASPANFVVPDNEAGRAVAAVAEGSSLRFTPIDDFVTAAWNKLLINAVVGAIGALTIRDISVMGRGDVQAAALVLAEEVAAVGRAEGADFAPDAAERMLEKIGGRAPGHLSSIAADRRDGRPLEWDARNAVVSRLGRRHGIPTPTNDLVTALLRACSAGD
ncbi:MAG: 2-dehydropantoate 2-reductase [Acidimicrobiales bacterium]